MRDKMTNATDKLIADGLAPIVHRDGAYDGNVWQSPNPCAIYANALKIAVGALRRIDKDLSGVQTVVREALAEINRIAENNLTKGD